MIFQKSRSIGCKTTFYLVKCLIFLRVHEVTSFAKEDASQSRLHCKKDFLICCRCLIECREEFKYNVDAVDCLIRSHLVSLQQYDMHLAQSMENGLNYMAVTFAMQLVQLYLVDERVNSTVTESDLYHTIEVLARIATHSRQPPEG